MVFQCHDRDAEARQYLEELAGCAADVVLYLTVLGKDESQLQNVRSKLQDRKERFCTLLETDHPMRDYLSGVAESNPQLLPDLQDAPHIQEHLTAIVSSAQNGGGVTGELETTKDYFRKVRDGLSFYLQMLETKPF
ncbi:hypothetical protein HY495_02125 [Candidatus Woesearchaeota archaeon]|nr:hypothetical protein [Candidatus Woesearchaeota archaeon]